MPVDTANLAVTAREPEWTRCRDAYDGSDAVKKAAIAYLPMLEGQTRAGVATSSSGYDAYKTRALYYPAFSRTVTGLAGLVFGKPPTLAGLPTAQEADLRDVTLTGVSLTAYAISLCQQLLITGRAGTLVDFPDQITPGARPYWVPYGAEQIRNWRTTRIGGRQVLTLLVLREEVDLDTGKDEFAPDRVKQFRVLRLVDGRCTVMVYREDPKQKGTFLAGAERVLLRRGAPVPSIPFVFHGPTGTTPDVEHPPLVDLADVNLSHYRTSADREHGAHWTALPTPYITGHTLQANETLSIGAGNAWVLPNPASTAGMVEFSGAGLSALKDLMEEKRLLMATLGARMLETQRNVQEAAQTVRLRHAGESSALGILAGALSQGLTQALRWHFYWSGQELAATEQTALTLNPDMLDELTADDIRALVTSWQAGAISQRTVLANMQWGEWLPPGVTVDQELEEIKREGRDNLGLPAGAAA